MEKLTPKQMLFVKAYLANGKNATQAAKTAGYSEATAGAIGTENLQKPLIRAQIQRGLAKQTTNLEEKAALLGVTRERMIEALYKTAFSDIKSFAEITAMQGEPYEENFVPGEFKVKPTDQWAPGAGKLVKSIKPTANGIALELEPRQPARELLCKMLGWTKDSVVNPNIGHVQIVVQMPTNGREAKIEITQSEPSDDSGT